MSINEDKSLKKNKFKDRLRRSSIYQKVKGSSSGSGYSLSNSYSKINISGRCNGFKNSNESINRNSQSFSNGNEVSRDQINDALVLRYLIENKLANLDFLQPRKSMANIENKKLDDTNDSIIWKRFSDRKISHLEKQDEVDLNSSSSSSGTKYHSVYSTKSHSIQLEEINNNEIKISENNLFECGTLYDDYKFIIYTIINPVGMSDNFLKTYMNDLISYTKMLMKIEDIEHDMVLEELQALENLPKLIQVEILDVSFTEFKSEDQGQIYCVLWMSNPLNDLKDIHSMQMQSSHMVSLVESMSWNEHFELNIENTDKDILNIRFLKKNLQAGESYFNRIKSSLKKNPSFIKYKLGDVKIEIKDIPCTGYEDDFFVTEKFKCRLRLQPCFNYNQFDKMSALYTLVLFSLKDSYENPKKNQTMPYFYSNESKNIINIFVKQHKIRYTSIEQNILELASLLTIRTEENFLPSILEEIISDKFKSLLKIDLTTYDVFFRILKQSLNKYISAFKQYLFCDRNEEKINLFSPNEQDPLRIIEYFGSEFISLCSFILNKNIITSYNLKSIIQNRLENSISSWIDNHFKVKLDFHSSKDLSKKVFTTIENLKVVNSFLILQDVDLSFFLQFNIDYYKTLVLCIDAMLYKELSKMAIDMDSLHCELCNDSDLLGCSSIQFFISIKMVHANLRKHIKKEEVLFMDEYQTWFSLSIPLWLTYFKNDCFKRIDMALALEKDLVAVDEDVKHSTSVVDVQTFLNVILAEWNKLEITNPNYITYGIVTLTEILCQGVGIYMCKVLELMEKNSYYDKINNQQFDVTDQLCISFNNILRMKDYLDSIPKLLLMHPSVKNVLETSQINKISDTIMRLIADAKVEIMDKEMSVLDKIINLIAADLKKKTSIFTMNPFKEDSLELINYCEDNLPVLCRKLEPTISKVFLERILDAGLKAIDESILIGENPCYYMKLKERIISLMNHFQDFLWTNNKMQLTEKQWKGYTHLHDKITMNLNSSQDLMLLYLQYVAEQMKKDSDINYGMLKLYFGYTVNNNGTINITGKVIKAYDLPGVNHEGLCNPYVKIALLPSVIFTKKYFKMSKKYFFTSDPKFDFEFDFSNILNNILKTEAVICFSVWHFNGWLPDIFLGEQVIKLKDIKESFTYHMLPLRVIERPRNNIFRILKARSKRRDEVALTALNERNDLSFYEKSCQLCSPAQKVVTKLTGSQFKSVLNS